jgi:hypothetical protein
MFLAVDKTKTPLRASQLRITRAPPLCCSPIIKSCIPPRLRPPLIIPQQLSFHYPSDGPPPLNVAVPTVLAPFWHPPLLRLFASIALLVAVCSRHHLPCCGDITPSSPPQRHRMKQTLPSTPAMQMTMAQTTSTQTTTLQRTTQTMIKTMPLRCRQ